MMSVLYLGAPDKEQLRRTWKKEYLTTPDHYLSQVSDATVWRRILLPEQLHDPAWSRESMEINDAALDTSFALYIAENPDTSCTLDEQTVEAVEAVEATQYPEYDFDMSSVLDVEDVYHAPMLDRNGRLVNHSMLAAIMSISDPKHVTTRAGIHTQVIILSLGDNTANGFEMAVWGSHAQYVLKYLRRLDVILIQDFVLSTFNKVLGGTSRQGLSKFIVLYRTDRQGILDDQYRPLLQEDAQSSRIRAIRDWLLIWVPSETQPEDPSMDTTREERQHT